MHVRSIDIQGLKDTLVLNPGPIVDEEIDKVLVGVIVRLVREFMVVSGSLYQLVIGFHLGSFIYLAF